MIFEIKTTIASLATGTVGLLATNTLEAESLVKSIAEFGSFGLIAFASSLDQIGPITRSVADAALLTNHLCGFDPRDSTSLKESVPDFTAVRKLEDV